MRRRDESGGGGRISLSATAALLILTALLFAACNERQKGMLQRLMATRGDQYAGEEVSGEQVKEYERHVRLFSDEVTDLVKKKGQLGIYYRMLAMEYMDQEMYGPAFDTFMKAMEIYPNNHILHYYAGVASSQLAETKPEEPQREELIERAAHYHRRAVELKGNYVEALYALSVLYIFELDRPYDAEEHVQKIMNIRSDHYRARFLLARIRVEQNRVEEAIEIYTSIAEDAPQQEMVDRAKENRERLMRGEYGG